MNAPWHKASFDNFLHERLPQLLAQQVPLVGYTCQANNTYTCNITITLASSTGEFQVIYEDLPQPDQAGIFKIKDRLLVVVPYATSDDLEQAEIFCVGEQLTAYLQKRLGQAPDDVSWDAALVKAWLPLDLWLAEFFADHTTYDWLMAERQFVQSLDQVNWLASQQHLRRICLQDRQHLFRPGHFGRTCPFETPEGPNIGRILHIALGAEIQHGKLVITDERPEATLGLSASMIPLIEHNAPERLLMGTNMMRQWLLPPMPEPALVQSGHEPDAPDFWCGRNLLTAFVSWGAATFEDGIVLSESCARRFAYPYPVEPGDKFSNRHGTKGVVSKILPDAEMPRLADGTPVELLFNFISQHARASFGQIREAVLGRIAHTEGKSMLVPPFHAPTEQQIRIWLAQAALPESGMERLIDGVTGKMLEQPSTVGWIYWGKLAHMAREKLIVSPATEQQAATNHERGQRLNEDGYYALCEAGAFANVLEQLTTSSATHPESSTLGQRLTAGTLGEAELPSPLAHTLIERLAAVGIQAHLQDHGLAFQLAEPTGTVLHLAAPVPHPWLRERVLTCVGAQPELLAYQTLVEANARTARILQHSVSESLKREALAQLQVRVHEYCAALSPAVQFETRVQYSGRAVLTPGTDLCLDQVGIAEDMAWSLFGPFVGRTVPSEEIQARSERALRALDEVMARSWVILHRSPAFTPQTFLAFHPVRNPERVIRVHPLVCRFLQADFDGDQAAIFLPLTEQTQQEAGARLSVAAHVARTPELLRDLIPNNDALWGLAKLSLTEQGRGEIAEIVGLEVVPAGEIVTHVALAEAFSHVLQRNGMVKTLERLERLMWRGFVEAKASGASLSPFGNAQLPLPQTPQGDKREAWKLYQAEVSEWFAAHIDYLRDDFGPQLLAVKSGAWGEIRHLVALLSGQGLVRDSRNQLVSIRHGYCMGLSATELFALAIGSREAFFHVQQEWVQLKQELQERRQAKSFHVLARAMRAEQPALVFAHAAAIGEVDPLVDRDSRLFMGLPVHK